MIRSIGSFPGLAATLLLLSAPPAGAAGKGESGQAASAAECALLDNPKYAGMMDGLLLSLARRCDRPEFLGGVEGEGAGEIPDHSPQAVDVPVSNPALDTPHGGAGWRTQSETSIAVNETTGTICAAFNDSYTGPGDHYSGFARSTDGGATFLDQGPIGPNNFGDPSLVWRKSDGRFYYAALAANGGLTVFRSTDDCVSFALHGAQPATGSDDKEIMAVDNTPASPYYGRMYIVWTDFGAGAQIFVVRSTDAGATWSAQTTLSAPGDDVQGAWPAVAPNGDVFVGWVRWNPWPAGPIDAQISRSTDGGVTWALTAMPMSGETNPRDNAATGSCGRPALGGNIRYLPNPTIAVDGSGNLHAVYSYDPDAFNVGDESNIYYRKSTDNGATWATEILINDDGGTTDQWQPSMSIGVGNVVTIGYYSRQQDVAGNLLFDYYARSSYDGGATFQPSVRLTDASSAVVLDPNLATCYHGDYDTQIHSPGKAHMLWSDDRDPAGDPPATPNVYTESVPAGTDYLLVPSVVSRTICAGQVTNYPIDNFQFQGFAESVDLSVAGNPPPTGAGFTVDPVPTPGSTVLNITNTGAVAFGTYPITISGESIPGSIDHSTQVTLNVFATPPGAVNLVSPADDAIDQPRGPVLTWGAVPQTVDYQVDVATDAAFTSIVRTATVTGTSWQVAPQLNILTEYFWRVTARNPCGNTVSGTYSFTTANPTVLLVDDDDNSPDMLSTYESLVSGIVVYDIWSVLDQGSEPTAVDLAPYRAVIWFTGDAFGGSANPICGPQTPAENALKAYLDNGGCFLISSQDYLYDMGGPGGNVPTPFMGSHLAVASGVSDTGDYTRVDGENVYNAYDDLTLTFPYIDYTDILAPNGTGQTAFRGDQGSVNVGAVSKRTPVYWTTFLSFGIETLTPANQAAVLGQFKATCDAQSVLFADNLEDQTICDWSVTEPVVCP